MTEDKNNEKIKELLKLTEEKINIWLNQLLKLHPEHLKELDDSVFLSLLDMFVSGYFYGAIEFTNTDIAKLIIYKYKPVIYSKKEEKSLYVKIEEKK